LRLSTLVIEAERNERRSTSELVWAVIVAYKPAAGQLVSLLASLTAQCGGVLVMDNGGAAAVRSTEPDWPEGVICIDMGGNTGLGHALNRGFSVARKHGARFVISFDQDSAPDSGLVDGLLSAYEALTEKGMPVAAVGPRFVDERYGARGAFPFMRLVRGWPRAVRCTDVEEFVNADFLITSGCLISIEAFDAVGEFDSGMFVDYTDIEWGFRANSRGFKLYGACAVVMRHELGLGHSASILGLTILGYSAVRRYYYARNTVKLLQLSYVPWQWRARMFLGLVGRLLLLPVTSVWRPSHKGEWIMYVKGIFAGMRGQRGECDDTRYRR